MPLSPKDLKSMASTEAKRLRKERGPRILTAAEQLRAYDQRVASDPDFFKKMVDDGKVPQLGQYVGAMEKLKRQQGKK